MHNTSKRPPAQGSGVIRMVAPHNTNTHSTGPASLPSAHMGSRERTRVEDIERASGGWVLEAQAEGCRQMTAAACTGHQNKKPPPPATTLTGQEAQATTSPRQLPLPQGAPHTAPQTPSMQNTSTTKRASKTHQTATGQPAGHTARPPRDASSLPLFFCGSFFSRPLTLGANDDVILRLDQLPMFPP